MCLIILCTASFCLCYFVQATAAGLTQFSCYYFLLAKIKLREGQDCSAISMTHLRAQLTQAISGASLGWISGIFYFCYSLSGQWADSMLVVTNACLFCVIRRSSAKSSHLVSKVTYISIWVNLRAYRRNTQITQERLKGRAICAVASINQHIWHKLVFWLVVWILKNLKVKHGGKGQDTRMTWLDKGGGGEDIWFGLSPSESLWARRKTRVSMRPLVPERKIPC